MDEYDYHEELSRAGDDEDETLHGRSYCMHLDRRVRDRECLHLTVLYIAH